MKNARPTEVKPSAFKESVHDINPADVLQNAPTKISRILAGLLTYGSLTTPEAWRLGDTCLGATIGKLSDRYGLRFTRTPENVPTRWAVEPTRFIRYAISDSSRADALAVLEYMMLKGRAAK